MPNSIYKRKGHGQPILFYLFLKILKCQLFLFLSAWSPAAFESAKLLSTFVDGGCRNWSSDSGIDGEKAQRVERESG